MMHPRRLLGSLLIAVMLVLGQHAGLLHGLAHGVEKVSGKQDPKSPASVVCLDCGVAAQLLGPPAAGIPGVHAPLDEAVRALFLATGIVARPWVVFRTRGPPLFG